MARERKRDTGMDTPTTRFLPCDHDPASVVVIPTEHGYRFRCPVCGAESFEREAPEWFREALSDRGDEGED